MDVWQNEGRSVDGVNDFDLFTSMQKTLISQRIAVVHETYTSYT